MGLRLCRVNWGIVTGSKECPYCLVFVLTFFVKGVDSFDKLVAGCCISDSLEGIGEYWKAWYLVVKWVDVAAQRDRRRLLMRFF